MTDERVREQNERPDSYADAVRRGEKPREDPKNVSSA